MSWNGPDTCFARLPDTLRRLRRNGSPFPSSAMLLSRVCGAMLDVEEFREGVPYDAAEAEREISAVSRVLNVKEVAEFSPLVAHREADRSTADWLRVASEVHRLKQRNTRNLRLSLATDLEYNPFAPQDYYGELPFPDEFADEYSYDCIVPVPPSRATTCSLCYMPFDHLLHAPARILGCALHSSGPFVGLSCATASYRAQGAVDGAMKEVVARSARASNDAEDQAKGSGATCKVTPHRQALLQRRCILCAKSSANSNVMPYRSGDSQPSQTVTADEDSSASVSSAKQTVDSVLQHGLQVLHPNYPVSAWTCARGAGVVCPRDPYASIPVVYGEDFRCRPLPLDCNPKAGAASSERHHLLASPAKSRAALRTESGHVSSNALSAALVNCTNESFTVMPRSIRKKRAQTTCSEQLVLIHGIMTPIPMPPPRTLCPSPTVWRLSGRFWPEMSVGTMKTACFPLSDCLFKLDQPMLERLRKEPFIPENQVVYLPECLEAVMKAQPILSLLAETESRLMFIRRPPPVGLLLSVGSDRLSSVADTQHSPCRRVAVRIGAKEPVSSSSRLLRSCYLASLCRPASSRPSSVSLTPPSVLLRASFPFSASHQRPSYHFGPSAGASTCFSRVNVLPSLGPVYSPAVESPARIYDRALSVVLFRTICRCLAVLHGASTLLMMVNSHSNSLWYLQECVHKSFVANVASRGCLPIPRCTCHSRAGSAPPISFSSAPPPWNLQHADWVTRQPPQNARLQNDSLNRCCAVLHAMAAWVTPTLPNSQLHHSPVEELRACDIVNSMASLVGISAAASSMLRDLIFLCGLLRKAVMDLPSSNTFSIGCCCEPFIMSDRLALNSSSAFNFPDVSDSVNSSVRNLVSSMTNWTTLVNSIANRCIVCSTCESIAEPYALLLMDIPECVENVSSVMSPVVGRLSACGTLYMQWSVQNRFSSEATAALVPPDGGVHCDVFRKWDLPPYMPIDIPPDAVTDEEMEPAVRSSWKDLTEAGKSFLRLVDVSIGQILSPPRFVPPKPTKRKYHCRIPTKPVDQSRSSHEHPLLAEIEAAHRKYKSKQGPKRRRHSFQQAPHATVGEPLPPPAPEHAKVARLSIHELLPQISGTGSLNLTRNVLDDDRQVAHQRFDGHVQTSLVPAATSDASPSDDLIGMRPSVEVEQPAGQKLVCLADLALAVPKPDSGQGQMAGVPGVSVAPMPNLYNVSDDDDYGTAVGYAIAIPSNTSSDEAVDAAGSSSPLSMFCGPSEDASGSARNSGESFCPSLDAGTHMVASSSAPNPHSSVSV